jgi:hypothetical protein
MYLNNEHFFFCAPRTAKSMWSMPGYGDVQPVSESFLVLHHLTWVNHLTNYIAIISRASLDASVPQQSTFASDPCVLTFYAVLPHPAGAFLGRLSGVERAGSTLGGPKGEEHCLVVT